MKQILLIIATFCLAFVASAQDDDRNPIEIEFTNDTARIEQEALRIAGHGGTWQISDAEKYREKEYDKLLNKYYKLLYNSLNTDAKVALKESQLKWIAFRDAEKKSISENCNSVYEQNGGGTIWLTLFADFPTRITYNRVIDLYNYYRLTQK